MLLVFCPLPCLSHSLCCDSSFIPMRFLHSFQDSSQRNGVWGEDTELASKHDAACSGFVNLDNLPPLVGEASKPWAQALFLYL